MTSNNMMAVIGREGKLHGVPLNFHSSVNSSLYENHSLSQIVFELVEIVSAFIVAGLHSFIYIYV